MQTIVAGTDFTKSSLNACNYAALLAGKYKCKLVIFNLLDVSWIHANSGLYLLETFKAKKRNERKINKQLKDLKLLFPKLR